MNGQPPTGDDLQRMLVGMKQEVLQRAATTPQAGHARPSWVKRHVGLTVGLVALLGLGGATGALALVVPPALEASAPAPTPTPEPSTAPPAPASPTPVAPPAAAPDAGIVPRPAADLDCAALGEQVGITTVAPGTTPYVGPAYHWSALDASARQAGVLDCRWRGDGGPYSDVGASIVVSPAAERGREWIDGLRASSLPDLGVGDVGALRCGEGDGACNSSFVVGPWWVEVSAFARFGAASPPTAEGVRAVASSVADVLAGTEPATPWVAPDTSWTTADACRDVSVTDLAGVLGIPSLHGPDVRTDFADTGILATQVDAVTCSFSPAADDPAFDISNWGLTVEYAPGSAWVVGTESQPGTPVEVAGADRATFWCIHDEGSACVLDVVQDGTWISISGGHDETPAGRARLVAAAEAVLAAHAAAS